MSLLRASLAGLRSGTSLSLLPAGTPMAVLGDSGYARASIFTATTAFSTTAGPVSWTTALVGQRVRHINWFDATATEPNLVPAYAQACAVDPLWRGHNFGLSGDTSTGILRRVAQVIASGAKLCFVRAGTNVNVTDSPVGVVTANLQSVVGQLVAGGVRVVIETIHPRVISLTPTGVQISPASMDRIVQINNSIRSNWAAWGAAALSDPWDALRDPAFPPGDQFFGQRNPVMFFTDGVHVSSRGGYEIAKVNAAIINQHVSPGRWFARNAGGLMPNWNLTGSSGTVGGSCTGQMPAGVTIANTLGVGQPVTAHAALSANPETGGQTVTIVVSSTGAGAANTWQEIRIANTALTAGLNAAHWYQFVPDFEVEGGPVLAAWQTKLGESSVISARGLGQSALNQGTATNEYYPTEPLMQFEPDTPPLNVGARANLVAWLSLLVRLDVAGSATVRLRRWRIPQVNNPALDAPWVP